MHDRIKLAAYTKIQLRDVAVDKGFIKFFHLLAGLANAVHKDLHRRGQTFPRRSL